MEVLNQIIIANELEYIPTSDYEKLRQQIEKVANKLNALRRAQLNN